MTTRSSFAAAVVALATCGFVPTAAAHVDYVTDPVGQARDAVTFGSDVLSDPVNAAMVAVASLVGVAVLAAYLRYRPTVPDVQILRETLGTYDDLVPWMLRLSLGLPLVGARDQPGRRAGHRVPPRVRRGLRPRWRPPERGRHAPGRRRQ